MPDLRTITIFAVCGGSVRENLITTGRPWLTIVSIYFIKVGPTLAQTSVELWEIFIRKVKPNLRSVCSTNSRFTVMISVDRLTFGKGWPVLRSITNLHIGSFYSSC